MTNEPPTPEEQEAASLYRQAFDLVEEERFSDARPILEECLRLNPGPKCGVPARQELARVLQELGDTEGALRLRWEVKRLVPDRHANLWKLAQLLSRLGRHEEALQEATEAARLQPANPHYRELVTQLRQITRPSRSSGPFGWLRRLFPRPGSTAGNRQLYEAAARGDSALAKSLAQTGANPNGEWEGRTFLSAAAATGNLAMAKVLLEIGADPNKPAKWKVTPLMLAAMAGHKEIVALLLKAGANVNARRDNGSTALLEAVACNQEETPRLLLEAGADVNVQGLNGITPLQMAAHNNMTGLVSVLVKHNARS